MKNVFRVMRLVAIFLACMSLSGCDDVRVYGSVGYSSYSGYGGGGYRTGVAVGGRIY